MKNLIFVGGIHLSGKTTFCELLASTNEDYVHVDFDKVAEYLCNHGKEFMKYIKEFDKSVYKNIRRIGKKLGYSDEADQLGAFNQDLMERKRLSTIDFLLNECSVLCVGDLLREVHEDITPIIDGFLINKLSREHVYDSIKQSVEYPASFDDVPKAFVYFNRGLDYSLDLLIKNNKGAESFKQIEESVIRNFKDQELPVENELPNTKLVLINNQADVEKAFEEVNYL